MNFFVKSLLTFSLILFVFSLSAQIPNQTGETQWDYCECLEGTQAIDDLCPCSLTYPPGGLGEPDTSQDEISETNSGNILDQIGTTIAEFFRFPARVDRCDIIPALCD